VPMPGLDGRYENVGAEVAECDVARSAFRARRRIALRDFGVAPVLSLKSEQIDTEKARGQNAVASVARFPVRNQQPVLHSEILFADDTPFPLARPVIDNRRLPDVIRWRSLRAG